MLRTISRRNFHKLKNFAALGNSLQGSNGVGGVNVPGCLGTNEVQSVRTLSNNAPWLSNIGIYIVPQQEAWIVEYFGRFNTILEPGIHFKFPFIFRVPYVQSLKEIAIVVDEQHAITSDNVTLNISGVLYVKVKDPYKASYGVSDPEFAITQLAQTTMRSEIGKISLDTVFRDRESLNLNIVDAINKAADAWGLDCLRYEIKDVVLPQKVQEAMQMQVEAERKKRAAILESEGIREADINVAEGKKQARILNSEAFRNEQINQAQGEAQALIAKAKAQAVSIQTVATALSQQNGMNAVSLKIAEQYVNAFGNLAKTSNTILLPSNTGDISNMVATAMSIYKNVSEVDTTGSTSGEPVDVKKLEQELFDINKSLNIETGSHIDSTKSTDKPKS